MPNYQTPGVYFEPVDVGRGGLTAIRTDIAAFVGIAARGPLHQPVPVNTWEQYRAVFGGFLPGAYLAYCVKAFFENGGRRCHVVLVAHEGPDGEPWSTESDPAVAQPVQRDESIVRSVEGFAPGGAVRVFQAPDSRQTLLVREVNPAGRRLRWERSLDTRFDLNDPARLLRFETGPAVASGVLLSGSGEVALSVEASSPGAWGNDLAVRVVSHPDERFTLTVYLAGRVADSFPNLSITPGDEQYVERVFTGEGTHFIRVTLSGDADAAHPRLPDPGAANLTRGVLRLHGGGDGHAGLTPQDFTGEAGVPRKRGLRTLEDVDEVALVAIPDILVEPTPPLRLDRRPPPEPKPCLPHEAPPPVAEPVPVRLVERLPGFSTEEVFGVQSQLIAHCEAQRDRIALLDPPRFPGVAGVTRTAEIQQWRRRFSSDFAALYLPWIVVKEPRRSGRRLVRDIPPSGHVAGVIARTDLETGVHRAPANVELRWAQGLTAEVSAEEQGLLNPQGINCLRGFPGRGLRVYGARTVSKNPDWRFVNVRRLFLMIEEAIEHSIQWAVFEPNNFYLRRTLVLAISSFLRALWERGALVGEVEEDAFYVKCDEENNPPETAAVGELIVEVGAAPVIPSEFVVFRIGRTENKLEIFE